MPTPRITRPRKISTIGAQTRARLLSIIATYDEVSLHSLEKSAQLSFETIRLHVNQLIKDDLVEMVRPATKEGPLSKPAFYRKKK